MIHSFFQTASLSQLYWNREVFEQNWEKLWQIFYGLMKNSIAGDSNSQDGAINFIAYPQIYIKCFITKQLSEMVVYYVGVTLTLSLRLQTRQYNEMVLITNSCCFWCASECWKFKTIKKIA